MKNKYTKRMSKWWIFISIIIVIVSICLTLFLSSLIPLVLPIEEANKVRSPIIDISKFNIPMELERLHDDQEWNIHNSNRIIYKQGPWSDIWITQKFIPKDFKVNLESKDGYLNFTKAIIMLETRYYIETFPLTIDSLFKNNRFGWIMLSVADRDEYKYQDERFDECFVHVISDLEHEIISITILVTKNQQIMQLVYRGVNLNVDDFLDELDRIL